MALTQFIKGCTKLQDPYTIDRPCSIRSEAKFKFAKMNSSCHCVCCGVAYANNGLVPLLNGFAELINTRERIKKGLCVESATGFDREAERCPFAGRL